jgi:DNA sulfur modification protein DndB
MIENSGKRLVVPALRGVMGNWVYYSCLLPIRELARRVDFATEVHKSQNLSDMIQRQLKTSRAKQISYYLENQRERLFNSLVIATYGGKPSWHAISSVKSRQNDVELVDLDDDVIESVGFLVFHGDERLFALDGQHRLAGIKKACSNGLPADNADEISALVVAHRTDTRGLERTRRLFTTLNKTARPVSKGDIIALDEDDTMAICVRRLIEESDYFNDNRVAFVASNNMPINNLTSITTIGNLYDILRILFTQVSTDLKASSAELQRGRPSDDRLDAYFELSKNFFLLMKLNFQELNSYFNAKNTESVVTRHRGAQIGSVLFRPVGLETFAKVIATLSSSMPLDMAVKTASRLPRSLTSAPYRGLMWDPNNETMINAHSVTVREVLLHMLGKSRFKEESLLARYRKALGDNKARLPKKM